MSWPSITDAPSRLRLKPVAWWLFACCVMVLLMVIVGGVTRLSDSGLSMTNWKPITGWLPPLTQEGWAEEFSFYQQSPQFQLLNHHMDVEEFKGIFWLEYIHRLLGRVTGFVFLLPLILFAWQNRLPKNLLLGLMGIFALGAMQGVIGWLMVRSGLMDNPYVSPFWLAFHLGGAMTIFALLWLLALWIHRLAYNPASDYFNKPDVSIATWLRRALYLAPALVFFQSMLGALVAGYDAGLLFNTFPDMNGQMIPDDVMAQSPWYHNFFYNHTMIQFQHRVVAYLLVAYTLFVYVHLVKQPFPKSLKYAINGVLGLICLQFALGVSTIIYQVPLVIASLHQVIAFILFAAMLYCAYKIRSTY